jgi:hypothetical protein
MKLGFIGSGFIARFQAAAIQRGRGHAQLLLARGMAPVR